MSKRKINMIQCPMCGGFTPVQVPKKKANTRKIWVCGCGNVFSIAYNPKQDKFGRIKLLSGSYQGAFQGGAI